MPGSDYIQRHPVYGEQRVLAVLKPAELYRLETLKGLLRYVFPRCEIVCPENLESLQLVLRRCQATHPLVLAVGGDGTLHQVLQAIELESQTLGLLPLGTGNDFARSIGYPASLRKKIARLASLTPQLTDFGEMSGHRFINSAGFGIDSASLALRANQPGNRLIQNYTMAFLRVLAELQPQTTEVEIDGERLTGEYYWVLAMNNRDIGGGTRIAPLARVDDGLLDCLLVAAESKWELLRNLPRALRGRHIGIPGITYRQANSMRCACGQSVRYLAADGELHHYGERAVEFRACQGRLMMLR